MTENPAKSANRTPNRNFRIEDGLYRAAVKKARSEGRTLSDVVRWLLSQYVSQELSQAGQANHNHV
jgi:hypothetical protein